MVVAFIVIFIPSSTLSKKICNQKFPKHDNPIGVFFAGVRNYKLYYLMYPSLYKTVTYDLSEILLLSLVDQLTT